MAKTINDIKKELGISNSSSFEQLLKIANQYKVFSAAEINNIKAISVLPLPTNVKDRAQELKQRFTDIVLNENKGQLHSINVRTVIILEILEKLIVLSQTALTASSIADDLTTNNSSKVLSAKQGYILKTMLDALTSATYTKTEINNYKKMWDNLVYSCGFTIDESAKTMTISGNWAFTKYSFIVINNIAVKTISYASLSLGNYCLVIRNNALEFVNFANAIQDGDMVLWIGFIDSSGNIRTDIYRCNNKVTNLALFCSDNIKIDTTNKNFVIPDAYLFWNSGYASITAQNISYASYLNNTCALVYRNGVFAVLGLQNIELFYNDVIVAVVWFRGDGFPMSKIYVVNEAPDKAFTELPLSSKIFMRVGVIGDSYTSGWIKDNAHKNNPNYSWVKYMKQLTGNEWTNFGVSGSSTKSWVDGTLGQLPQVQTKGNKCQAYVIGLMINDQNTGASTYVPLGTSSDIGTNENSYYAYYYKLINALLSVNSSAIIFCNTCPRTDGDFPSYNQAVIDVVNYCQSESKKVYLVELRNYYWGNKTFNNDALNGHYTAIGYEYMAEIFNKAFSDTINANASSLKEVNLIPYDSATVYDYVDKKINNTNTQLEITNDKVTTLQDDVADLKSVQNVVEVVATKSALNSYDTTKLDVNDKVQVIADETHDGASTIYNWNGTQWQYVGAFGGNSYTKQESDNKFAPKTTAVTHTGNQLKDYNGNNIYPNIAGVHYHLYKGKAYRGLFATDHTAYLDLNEYSNELYKHTYTQILLIKNDLKLKVLNSTTHQIRKITFNNPIAENVTFSTWGSELSLSKGDYCVIMISLKNSTTEDVTVDEMINNILFSNNDYDVLDTIVSNRNWNSQTHYLEIINDKEITYNFGNLANLGYKINVWKLNAWDITTGRDKELEIGWQPNVFEFTFPKGIYKIFFRKYNSNNALIDFNYNEIMTNITVVEKPKEKHIHISIDDCVFWSDLIANQNTYTSIFDNSLLNLYKQLHDTYGMVITLNLFNVNNSYDISNVPTKFANEFSSNSMWLKLSFHAEDSTTYYDVDKVDEITASYNKFVSAVYQMTKDFNCIDGVVRLGFFSGTLNNIKAIRDCKCGIKGLFTADDTRVSYYLDTATNNFILNHSKYFDTTNQIELIKTQTRLESETIDYSNLNSKYSQNVNYANFSHYYEFFTHEYEINSEMILKMKNLCLWAILNNYKFVFYQDLLKL